MEETMPTSDLRKRVVKLANTNPKLRPLLVKALREAADDEMEAGRVWRGTPGKAYDSPPSPGKTDCYAPGPSGGKGKPGKGETCYRLHNEYGSGVSKNKKEYNRKYREDWMDSATITRKTCPDGHGGKMPCPES